MLPYHRRRKRAGRERKERRNRWRRQISVSGCGEFSSWEESGLCSDGESIFRVSQSLTAGASESLYSRLLTDDSVPFDNEALCVLSWESHQSLVTAWHRPRNLHGSHKCQTGSENGERGCFNSSWSRHGWCIIKRWENNPFFLPHRLPRKRSSCGRSRRDCG